MKKYKASLDRLAWIITIGIVLLLGFGGYTSVKGLTYANETHSGRMIHILALVVFSALVFGTWLFAPRTYSIDESSVVIHRPASKKVILLNDIESVRLVEKGEMRGSIRTFGVGGMFGYYGKFSAPQLGGFTMYATQMRNLVLLKLKSGKQVMLSPDDTSLVQELAARLRRSDRIS